MKSKLQRNSLRFGSWGYVVGVLLTGAVWGLGLARLLAELGGVTEFQISVWPSVVLAATCAATVYVLRRRICRRSVDSCEVVPLLFPLLYVIGWVDAPLGGIVLLSGGLVLCFLLSWTDDSRWVPPVALAAIVSGVYLNTMLPSLGEADTFEFQVIAPLLGVAHPTGYPLYVLLGKLFTLLPFGTVAWRVNLLSVCLGTGAVVLLYRLVHRLTGRWLIAFVAALAFAFSATFWSQAIIAEVYALHNLLTAAILLLLLPVVDRGSSGMLAEGVGPRAWKVLAFLFGLSLTNHLTTILLLPAVGLAFLWDRPNMRLQEWCVAAGLAFLGLSVYSFIPLRWPALNDGVWMNLREFLTYITGGQFHGALRLDGWLDPARWQIVARLMLQPYGVVGVCLSIVGVVGLSLRDRRALALTGVTFLAFVFYGVSYYVPDISVFVLPAHLVLAVWLGIGVSFLIDLVSHIQATWPIGVHRLVGVLFALLPMASLWRNLPVVDQSVNTGREEWGRYVLALPLRRNAVVLADAKKFAPLYYVQQVEGLRPDLELILLGTEELYQQELSARLAADEPVYLGRYLPHLEGLRLRSVGPLVEVGTGSWVHAPVPQHRVDIQFGEGLHLFGCDVGEIVESPGRSLRLTLYWQVGSSVDGDYVIKFRLVDETGRTHWENEGARPVSGLYPTNAWTAGEKVSDFHELVLPPYLDPGPYQLQVGVFPQFSSEGLPVGEGGGIWADLQQVILPVATHCPALPSETQALFGATLWLTGYDMPTEAVAGSNMSITLGWRAASSVLGQEHSTRLVPRLVWLDDAGDVVAASEAGWGIELGDSACKLTRHTVQVPEDSGTYHLAIGVEDGEGYMLGASCRWLGTAAAWCPLVPVAVLPEQQGLANYAGLFLLHSARVAVDETDPGGVVPITFHWRALRATDDDFTVFVHLVGPDGRLHGQVDAWPVQGTYPTSQWKVGSKVSDMYEVHLDSDAPGGLYRVEVGWYLLETMQRLQVVGEYGEILGDSVVVGEFSVR